MHFNRDAFHRDRRIDIDREIRLGSFLKCSFVLRNSKQSGKRGNGDAPLLETCSTLEFHVSRRGSGSCRCSARRWFVFTESESKSRLRGTKCTPVLRDATFTFYVYSLRL